jgi:hypothetical protein
VFTCVLELGHAEVVLQRWFSFNAAFMGHDAVYMNEPPLQGMNDMGFLQTTIYTIVGECYIDCRLE